MTDRTKNVVPRHDPSLATSQAVTKMLGTRTQASQDRAIVSAHRYGRDKPHVPTTFLSHVWHRQDIPSNILTSGFLMYRGDAAGALSWVIMGQQMARPGRVVGGFLEMSGDWTAGKIHLCLVIDGVTVNEYDDSCAIDGTDLVHPRTASFFVPYASGYDFAEDEEIRAAFRTSSSFPGGTLDVRGSFLLAYD